MTAKNYLKERLLSILSFIIQGKCSSGKGLILKFILLRMVIWHDWVSCLHTRNEIGSVFASTCISKYVVSQEPDKEGFLTRKMKCKYSGKHPSEKFAVSFFADNLLKEETSEFYSRACFVIFKLNLLPKPKKLKDLKMGVNVWAKGPLQARRLGGPSDGLNDPPLEKINWNAAVQYHPMQCLLFLCNMYHR